MPNDIILSLIPEWTEELKGSLSNSKNLCFAIFSEKGELLLSNPAMSLLFKGEPSKSLINPTLDKLLETKSNTSEIYNGILTIGDYTSVSASINSHIFRKNNQILIIGGVDANQLLQQNSEMHSLNREVSNLQRQLIKEKRNLENTLEQLNIANQNLQDLNATKDKLFSIIAHDLRNPLGGIISGTEILSDNFQTFESERIEFFLKNIGTQAENLLELLDNLLNWAKSQTGQINFSPKKININNFISEVIQLQGQTAIAKNITLQHTPNSILFAYADPNMVSTILRNLASNAIKFTQSGGSIIVEAIQNNETIEISVSDSGVGMSSDVKDKIFDKNTNITTEGTANEKGSGLGLILCKDFAEINGGKIWVESELGIGSTFTFTLPEAFS